MEIKFGGIANKRTNTNKKKLISCISIKSLVSRVENRKQTVNQLKKAPNAIHIKKERAFQINNF